MPALLGRVSSMQVIVTFDSEDVILDLHGRSCVIQTLAHKDDVNFCAINACCEHSNHACIKLFGSTFLFDTRVLTHVFPRWEECTFRMHFRCETVRSEHSSSARSKSRTLVS